MDDSPRLIANRISPWSERARWALDHHGISYRLVEHLPFVHERRLRRMVGSPRARVTVPVLLHGADVLTDSWDIALFADRAGKASPLIPPDRESEVRRWVQFADDTSAEGRALVTAALLASPGALDETLPPSVPSWLRPALRPITRGGVRWFARKYDLRFDAPAQEQRMRDALLALRGALANRAVYLLGSFTYADIAVATVLQGVSPVGGDYVPLGPATRAVWTLPALAGEFADLVRWRDDLYQRHRAQRLRSPAGATPGTPRHS